MEEKSAGYSRNAGEKSKRIWGRRRDKYYQRNGYASEDVERLRAKGRLMSAEQESKKEGRESKNPDTIGSMRGV
jgi:hypothetical protein